MTLALEYTGPHTEIIDESRNRSEEVQDKTRKAIKQLLTEDTKEIMNNECGKFFPGKENEILRNFFADHPNRWSDICRIIHSHFNKEDFDGKYEVPIEHHDEIYTIFIINGKNSHNGKKLHDLVETSILNNKSFLKNCSNQLSLLDQSSDLLTHVKEGKLKQTIKGLISKGMISNIEGCNYDNINDYIYPVFKKIIQYLPEVISIYINPYKSLKGINTLDDLASRLYGCISNPTVSNFGKRRLDVMRIIQAFHAWGNITEIEAAQENAQQYAEPNNMRKLLKKGDITLNKDIVTTIDKDNNIIYKGTVEIKGRNYGFVWRAKSMKSILAKLWETPEYTNINAMRDMLGASIIFKKEDESSKVDIISTVRNLFPDYGFISKNKGLLNEEEIRILNENKNSKHHPMFSTPKRGDTTDKNMINASEAGFIKLNELHIPCGLEVQILSEDAYKWKQLDDQRFKVSGKLQILLRGEKMSAPNDLYRGISKMSEPGLFNAINKLKEDRSILPIQNSKDLLVYLIHKGEIIPYTRKKSIIFTIPTREKKFLNEYHGWEKIDYTKEKAAIDAYIDTLYIEPSDA